MVLYITNFSCFILINGSQISSGSGFLKLRYLPANFRNYSLYSILYITSSKLISCIKITNESFSLEISFLISLDRFFFNNFVTYKNYSHSSV